MFASWPVFKSSSVFLHRRFRCVAFSIPCFFPVEKIRTYRPEQIFVTQDTHPDNYLETNEGIEPWRG